jgi:nitrite reductase/ring-hydroxylating ferredoxin subunit
MSFSGSGAESLPPFPNGWYAVAWSSEVGAGDVVTSRLAGTEVVVFRTRAGASVMEAHCPHLGAHLGLGGTIVGEAIRCPFHGFCFDGSGNCVATGYGSAIPAGLAARVWPVVETDGAIFAWHHGQGLAPTFRLPDFNPTGYRALMHRSFQLKDHPQETTENSVDLGHFAVVHGYRQVQLIKEMSTSDAYLNIGYSARRPLRPLGSVGPDFETGFEYDIHIHGLGYSQVDVTIPDLGLEARLLVLATPRDGEVIDLRLGLWLQDPVNRKGFLRAIPAGAVGAGAARFILNGFASDARQDFPIWENKAYVDPPRLARGDGPIGLYRRWAKQFYS